MTLRPISVIICTHNRASLLPGVVRQIRAQNYPASAFEIIVVDNGSTDETEQVVRQLIGEPGVPVRYVPETRIGITFARNRGAEMASYPWLAYLDDDCRVSTEWLSQLVQGFELHKNVVAVAGRVVVDWDGQPPPVWAGPNIERWLASNSHLGLKPIVFNEQPRVIEANMAVKREAWKTAAGFLGMEQFGSHHMAASEVLYLVIQIERQGGKVAYVPDAVAHHHIGKRTWQWMLQRAYWQGVSDSILDALVHRRSWLSTTGSVIIDVVAFIYLLGCGCLSQIEAKPSDSMFHLMRAIRRIGMILGKVHFVGDWHCVRSWTLTHPVAS